VSIPHNHPLRNEELRTTRQLVRMRGTWLQHRKRIEDLRKREFQNVCNGDTARDDRLREALDQLYEVRESLQMFNIYWDSNTLLPVQLRSMMRIEAEIAAVVGEPDPLVESAEVVDVALAAPPVLPPGVENIQKSPRRPGAPATQAV